MTSSRIGPRTYRSLLATLLLASTACAQEIPELLQPLRHGPLTIWVIGPAQPKVKLASNYAQTAPGAMDYKEQNSGSFGQSASNYGQSAGSYGLPSDTPTISTRQPAQGQDAPEGSGYREQTAGSFGQTSSSTGTNASDHGQNAGSFGQNAASVGTNASNHGQTAGSFGQAAGSFGVGATPSGQPGTSPGNPAKPAPSRLQQELAAALKAAFPDLYVRFTDIPSDQLQPRLTAALNSGDYPDILVGQLPDTWDNSLRARFVLLTIQPASVYNDGLADSRPQDAAVSITTRAPHREPARAMALWASELGSPCNGCLQADSAKTAYSSVAITAATRLLQGQPIADLADPQIAAFPPILGRSLLLTSANTTADDSAAHLQVVNATRNGRLAAVSLRMVATSEKVFGTAHPLVILRLAADNQWKVLHISLNLPAADEERARQALMSTTPNATAEAQAGVLGVKLATPAEGDTRPPLPDLSWDNAGGAGLQVVEWQTALDTGWSDPRLFLVSDNASRLQTQVTAAFAIHQTRYRWRVWSIGAGGETKLSPWRTFNVAQ
jgi:hypothetical protein